MNGGTARGASVFDVVDRHPFNTDLAAHHLPGDRQLPLQLAVGNASVEDGTDIGALGAGIRQRTIECLQGHVLEAAIRMAPELGHGDAGNIDWFHQRTPGLQICRLASCQ
ncbi:hypothetical protein D3C75_618690 [compost metagenome]